MNTREDYKQKIEGELALAASQTSRVSSPCQSGFSRYPH